MGFLSFVKKWFTGTDVDEAALDAARARHGIKVSQKEKRSVNKSKAEKEPYAPEYDVWEELRYFRSSFFIGRWASRKLRPIGEDKLKKKLAELEKKREEERRKKEGESNNITDSSGAP
jgi:hypothetical protein